MSKLETPTDDNNQAMKLITGSDVGEKRGLDAVIQGVKAGTLQQISDTGATTIVSILSTGSGTAIAGTAGQQDITFTNLSPIKIHHSLTSPPTTSNDSLSKGDSLVKRAFNGTIHFLAASGNPNLQVDRDIKS